MKKEVKIFLLVFVLLITGFAYYLFRPISNAPLPANFICLKEDDGYFVDFDSLPRRIYGFGLSYAEHITQTSVSYDPGVMPPVFIKEINSLLIGQNLAVNIPSKSEMKQAMQTVELGLDKTVYEKFPEIQPLMDYEVELGMIVLEDISLEEINNKNFIPKLGFFIANDISERSIAILGDGQSNTYDYWGISKSFDGFSPLPEKYWMPKRFQKNQIPCVTIKTKVNGDWRQSEKTTNMIYTPEQLLAYISFKYKTGFYKGDIVLSGTPGGTAIHAPRWKLRIGKLLKLRRFTKLNSVFSGDTSDYLSSNDTVTVSGDWLGELKVIIK